MVKSETYVGDPKLNKIESVKVLHNLHKHMLVSTVLLLS